MSLSKGKNWEGLGGPVVSPQYGETEHDPTLHSCCQRDLEEQRVGTILRNTLRKYDIVAERERRRRHTISFNHSSSNSIITQQQGCILNGNNSDTGCRCSYDPNGDGGEYRALIELRKERSLINDTSENDEAHEKRKIDASDNDDGHTETRDSNKRVESTFTAKTNSGSSENECDEEEEEDDEYDYLLDDDGLPGVYGDNNLSIKALEEERRNELEWEIFQNEIAILHGYGIHRQIHPQRILSLSGLLSQNSNNSIEPPPYVVLHLVDADSIGSASLDIYLEHLATKFRGTMFVRSSGRATLLLNDTNTIDTVLPMFRNYTISQNVDACLPALVAIRHGIAINACLQLQGLLSTTYSRDDYEIEPFVVRDWLDRCNVLQERPPPIDRLCRIRPEEEALLDSCTRRRQLLSSEFIDEAQRYDCGKYGCNKSFPHEHIGERNEQQDGLLVSEAEILN